MFSFVQSYGLSTGNASHVLFACADNVAKKLVCTTSLSEDQAATFRKAVKKHYWYELFMDELPVWGFVGLPPEEAKDDEHIYLYTHKSLEISYNDDRVSCLLGAFCWAATNAEYSTTFLLATLSTIAVS